MLRHVHDCRPSFGPALPAGADVDAAQAPSAVASDAPSKVNAKRKREGIIGDADLSASRALKSSPAFGAPFCLTRPFMTSLPDRFLLCLFALATVAARAADAVPLFDGHTL